MFIYVTWFTVSLGMTCAALRVDMLGVVGVYLFLALIGFCIGALIGGPDDQIIFVFIAIVAGWLAFLLWPTINYAGSFARRESSIVEQLSWICDR